MPPEELDITNVRVTLSLKTLGVILGALLTLLSGGWTAYSGISGYITKVNTTLTEQTHTITQQTTEIKTLKDSNDLLKQQMLELTVTLRTKGVIK